MNIAKLSSDDEDDENGESNHYSNKKDEKNDDKNGESNHYFDKKDGDNNQDSDASSKTDLNDLHKLKSFLYEELK